MLIRTVRSLAYLLLIAQAQFVIPVFASSQNPAGQESSTQEKPLKLRTQEVVVDAVIIDKKNHLVSDLTAGDFEVFEDGVKQKISSFRFESSSAASLTTTAAKNTSVGV